MSYAIANVIYGIPITPKVMNWFNNHPDAQAFSDDIDEMGFETPYSGSSSSMQGWCGVDMGGFEENDLMRVMPDKTGRMVMLDKKGNRTPLTPTGEQMVEAMKKIAQLPKTLREVCDPIGVYVVWSTS